MTELSATKGGSVYYTAYGIFNSFSDFTAYMGQMPDSATLISSLNSSTAYNGSSSSAITYVTKDANGLVVGGNFSYEMTQYYQNNIENQGAGTYIFNQDYGPGNTGTPWFYFPTTASSEPENTDPLANGYCTFNSMAYLANLFGNSIDAGTFLNNYIRQYSMGDFVCESGNTVDYLQAGTTSNFNTFLDKLFSTSSYLNSTSAMRTELDSGSRLMAAMGNHNVIITSYNGNVFYYDDPTTGNSGSILYQTGKEFSNVKAICGFNGTGSDWQNRSIRDLDGYYH